MVVAVACPLPPPAYTFVDFANASGTVGVPPGGYGNGAGVRSPTQPNLIVSIQDTPYSGTDTGYQWTASTGFFVSTPPPLGSICTYPIVRVRATATLGTLSYPLNFDGYQTNGTVGGFSGPGGPQQIPTWLFFTNGDKPTLTVQSMTIDTTVPPTCVNL